jgi:hypothetical protein
MIETDGVIMSLKHNTSFKVGDLVQMVFFTPVEGVESQRIAFQLGVVHRDLGLDLFEILWLRHNAKTVVHRIRLKKADKKCP